MIFLVIVCNFYYRDLTVLHEKIKHAIHFISYFKVMDFYISFYIDQHVLNFRCGNLIEGLVCTNVNRHFDQNFFNFFNFVFSHFYPTSRVRGVGDLLISVSETQPVVAYEIITEKLLSSLKICNRFFDNYFA